MFIAPVIYESPSSVGAKHPISLLRSWQKQIDHGAINISPLRGENLFLRTQTPLTAIPHGPSPAFIVATTVLLATSITDTSFDRPLAA